MTIFCYHHPLVTLQRLSDSKLEDVLSMCDESIFDRRRYNEAQSEDVT